MQKVWDWTPLLYQFLPFDNHYSFKKFSLWIQYFHDDDDHNDCIHSDWDFPLFKDVSLLFVQERIVHMIWWWYSESNTFLERWLRGLCVEMKLSSVQIKPLSINVFRCVCAYECVRECIRRKHMLQSIRNGFPIMMIKRGWLKCFARFHSIYLLILYKNLHQ